MSARVLAGSLMVLGWLCAAQAQSEAPSLVPIETRMAPADWQAAGLDKLSADELAALNAWLARSRAVASPPPASQPDRPTARRDAPAIAARIQGEFKGWKGNTVFRLDNGQVWRQRVGGRYRSPTLENPEVLIEKGAFGYYLKVLEADRSIGVKRVR